MEADLLIRGGEVIDGSGAPPRAADLAVAGDRILAIVPAFTGQARRVIEARGHVVAPGFIDIHTHSDTSLPWNPRAESKVRQGVTLEVLGNCGYSVAPVLAGRVELLRDSNTPFGHYARDLGLLSLPRAVHKMTGAAAALDLTDRGLLREGHHADVAIFDPKTIAETATYDDPHRYPAGIATVLVNGVVVVDGGEHTGALPGRVLRRGPAGVR